MMATAASSIYGAVVRLRRQGYARDPCRQRHLVRPVVSVGNLRAGGAGKTPAVACLARLLADGGERPAILSRGYARRRAADGVTVVSDGSRVVADLDEAGDEPLMLARALPGVMVLVGADRFLAGRLAEERLGATLHLLDDGFQHLALARDVDLLIVDEADLADRLLPAGRLRETLEAARRADAILTPTTCDADGLRQALGVSTVFGLTRRIGWPRWLAGGDPVALGPADPVLAAAAIGRPDRFFDDLSAAGWHVVGTLAFRDHHRFTARDVERLARACRSSGARAVLVTDKDAVRLESRGVGDLPLASVPLTVTIDAPSFEPWLLARLRATT
jgi:tetraacyldisaccharide 4'-kinase